MKFFGIIYKYFMGLILQEKSSLSFLSLSLSIYLSIYLSISLSLYLYLSFKDGHHNLILSKSTFDTLANYIFKWYFIESSYSVNK
jgi:hypothetical protein